MCPLRSRRRITLPMSRLAFSPRLTILLSSLLRGGSATLLGSTVLAGGLCGFVHFAEAADLSSADVSLPPLSVVSNTLDQARSQIQPSLGAATYHFSRTALETIPQGDNAPLQQVLLQAPGVAQDSFGQIHIRGDHGNVQYRLNGVQLPEGLSVFGQVLETRFAHSLSLIMGALPAQYGFREAGVVDIVTKNGTTDPGGQISVYGGARDYFQPSFAYGGRKGAVDYFLTGDYLLNRVGIENPTGSFNAIHDQSNQWHGMAQISGIINDTTRISTIVGSSTQHFQIPNRPGLLPSSGYSVNGIDTRDSATLNQRQREITNFAILSLQKHYDTVDVQSSVFTRYSSLYYAPDQIGELLFNGFSQSAARGVTSTGAQTDASWKISDHHTVRGGFLATIERATFQTSSQVFATDDSGQVASGASPYSIYQAGGRTGGLYGIYLQDEWKILPRVTINYGARFDVVDEYTHENQLSPRVNIVWMPTDRTSVHAGYARYFTPPTFELLSTASIAAFQNTTAAAPGGLLNNTVKAERANYFDIGIDQQFLPGWRGGVDGYYKQATNLLDEGQFGAPIILTSFNYARGYVGGVQFDTTFDRGPWSVYANVAWSKAMGKDIVSAQFNFDPEELEQIKNSYIHLDHDQRITASAGAAYTLFQGTHHPLRMSGTMLFGSGLRSDGAVPNGSALPPYGTFNFSAVQTLDLGFGKSTQIRLDVINLFDSTYMLRDGTGVGVGAPQYGLRRTILAGLTQRF
ncbi:TonB dependent receptor [Granulibacter bethesdensis]|uniref:TonB dependent receptor n=2 Tax=Granulibacter bethesdensis TaxID=364410 RepID=A0AAN0RE01_9PROT|nr:TonB dependent receptor [Granulibacter bethesdensis]